MTKFIRPDHEYEELAERLGYEIVRRKNEMHNFILGKTHVWYCVKGWAVAELRDDNVFFNHKYYDTLKEALIENSNNPCQTVKIRNATVVSFGYCSKPVTSKVFTVSWERENFDHYLGESDTIEGAYKIARAFIGDRPAVINVRV